MAAPPFSGFPTASQCSAAPLSTANYDLAQLSKALQAAVASGPPPAEPVDANVFFHVHTLTLELPLEPEPKTMSYPSSGPGRTRERRDNESRPSWEAFRDLVCDGTDACEAVPLCAPSPNVIHVPGDLTRGAIRARASSGRIFLPSARNALQHVARLPLILPNAARIYGSSATAWDMDNWLHATLALDPSALRTRRGVYRDDVERVHLRTGIGLTWAPVDPAVRPSPTAPQTADNGVEIRLRLTIQVYFNMDSLFVPLPAVGTELLRLIFRFLLAIEPAAPADPDMALMVTSLADFYDCLHPAPELPLGFDTELLQPPEMMHSLFPFQKRTLARLLEREGKPIVGERPAPKPPAGQWGTLHMEGFGVYALHRLSGELRSVHVDPALKKGEAEVSDYAEELAKLPSAIDLSSARGTMLCEEMGLGKTVEAIALMLLHPHPLSTHRLPVPLAAAREMPIIDLKALPTDFETPSMKAWLRQEHTAFADAQTFDEESQLTVSQVSATLVVTPQPLLKQWCQEMAKHAPSLRVCVYPGWKILVDQVKAARAKRLKAKRGRADKQTKRENKRFRNATRRKYSKDNAGNRQAVEYESEDESEDEKGDNHYDDEDSLLSLTQRAWLNYVRGHDVVITTYQTLGDDIHVALPPPKRSRRSTAKYGLGERPRSPLCMVAFWRVIMDEVQLQGDQSAAAAMVAHIPRTNSLAMSGTPARQSVADLYGSLRFLRIPVDRQLYSRLARPVNRAAFNGLFQPITVRTTKAEVQHEFTLPKQTRFVVPIEMSDIEMHYYLDTLERQRERLRIDMNIPDAGRLDPLQFQTSLRHLRQICTHVQVGMLQARAANGTRAERLHLGRQLMTMSEALDKIRLDHENEHQVQARNHMRSLIRKAQLTVFDDRDPESKPMRLLSAQTLYERVREAAEIAMKPAQKRLSELTAGREDSVDDDSDDPDEPKSQKETENSKAIVAARQCIRETLLVLHQSWFYEGDLRHDQEDTGLEDLAYAKAMEIRTEILSRPRRIAENHIQNLGRQLEQAAAIQSQDELCAQNTNFRGGLVSTDTVEQTNSLLRILNDNAVLVFNWRKKVVELLQRPVEDDEDKVAAVRKAQGEALDGEAPENAEVEQYADDLNTQGELDAYLTGYAAAIADRKEMILEQRTALDDAEGRITKKRTTKAAREAEQGAVEVGMFEAEEGLTLELMRERQAFRNRRKEEGCDRPLKGLLVDLSGMAHSQIRPEEVAIVTKVSTAIRAYIKDQVALLEKLSKELDVFRGAFNKRVGYFSALQEISDSVAPPEFKNIGRDLDEVSEQLITLEVTLARMAVRGRYLRSLSLNNNGEEMREDCTICYGTSEDEFAIIMPCGHSMCQSCFKEYRKRETLGRRCPSCKADIHERLCTRVRIDGQEEATSARDESGDLMAEDEKEPEDVEEQEQLEREARSADLRRLNIMSDANMRDVASLDILGDYGSKINFLIKHLRYYRITKPKVRHVVFSNWGDSLSIVERALKANNISFVSFEKNSKNHDVVQQFRSDPSIMVFLLHAERESAGLTLTECGVVHLLEPVLQHSFELQAIGRVDRLGQTKETTVYCYATMDTVESRILSQGVRKGTSIYLADAGEDEKTMAAMPHVASAANRGGDLTLAHMNQQEVFQLIM